jgi:hypothetical protein
MYHLKLSNNIVMKWNQKRQVVVRMHLHYRLVVCPISWGMFSLLMIKIVGVSFNVLHISLFMHTKLTLLLGASI